MSSGTFGKGDESSTTQVQIPDFLRPFITQATGTASRALSGLESVLTSPEDLIAGFSPFQNRARTSAASVAEGGGDFIPTAEQVFLDTAGGSPLSSFIPEAAFENLTGTAGGDFLDSEAFTNEFEAALRQIDPAITSRFSQGGGIGAARGGLAEAARTRAAADAFSGLLSRERGRQLQASGLLSSLAEGERGRQLSAARILPEVGLLRSNIFADLGEQDRDLEQELLRAPLDARLQLLSAALGGVPISSLLGQSTDAESSGFSFGFG